MRIKPKTKGKKIADTMTVEKFWMHTTCDACNKRIRLERQVWKSGSAEEFLTESNPDNNPDKVSQDVKLRNEIDGLKYVVKKLEQEAKEWNLRLQDPAPIHVLSSVTMSREVSQDEIAKLRRERDEARREVCEMNSIESSNESVDFLSLTPQDIADERGWDCYTSDTLSQGLKQAKEGKFSKNPPKIKPTTKKKKKK